MKNKIIELLLWFLHKLGYNTEKIKFIDRTYYDIKTFSGTYIIKSHLLENSNLDIRPLAKERAMKKLINRKDFLSLIGFIENTTVNGDVEITALLTIGVKRNEK
jgi:hypothetical protein